jgi:adenosine deaminase
MCPSSNVQTGAAASIAAHPIHRLDRLGFRVTVNPDNRLMSATTLTREFALLAEAFDYSLADVRRLTVNAAKSVFSPYDVRKALVERIAAAA